MLRVGLTGGIGSGKSTVAQLFTNLGAAHIDADSIAHDLVKPGKPALSAIVNQFGADILTDNDALDRSKLRDIVFADANKKQQLEAVLHPMIFTEIRIRIQKLQQGYVIISLPLLIETRQQLNVDRVLVVDCPETTQIERVQHRDGLDLAKIQAIMAVQCSREQRLEQADDIIQSDCHLEQLAQRVKKLHNSYIKLSK